MARSLPALKNAAVFHAWSYRIIVHQAITEARRRPRTQALDALTEHGVDFDQSDSLDLYNVRNFRCPTWRNYSALLCRPEQWRNCRSNPVTRPSPVSLVYSHSVMLRQPFPINASTFNT